MCKPKNDDLVNFDFCFLLKSVVEIASHMTTYIADKS